MDPTITDMIASVLVIVVPVLVAYLRKLSVSKGVSEVQSELIFDFVGEKLDDMATAKPDDKNMVVFNKAFKKLHKMWDKDTVTTEEMEDFLEELDE